MPCGTWWAPNRVDNRFAQYVRAAPVSKQLPAPAAGAALLVGLCGSVGCSLILHNATARSDVVAIVPVALAWGAVVVALARRFSGTTLLAVAICALLLRLPLVGAPPHLSDDLYRYLWEGTVLNAGYDPFATAPSALPGIDDALRAQVAHPDVPSI